MKKEQKKIVIERLLDMYPDAKAELDFTNPFELVIATVLSAQCTDVRVNIITKDLFKVIKEPKDLVEISKDELEGIIKSCGMYKQKAKNLKGLGLRLLEAYDGQVPSTREELMTLPGVGRKTANVVVSNAFDTPAIAVDTHVFRVSNRIGLVRAKDVEGTERQLMKVIPRENWTLMHHALIFHGRRVCKARTPMCSTCGLNDICDKKIRKV